MNFRGLVICFGLTVIVGAVGTPIPASAQTAGEPQCPYLECSLRLKSGFFGRSLVRGAEEEKVTGLGFWIGNLDPAFEGNPEALALGARFRYRHNLGSMVGLAGLAAFVTGYSQADGSFFSPEGDLGVGLVVGGYLLTFVAAIITQSGEDELHRAIWEYNGTMGR